MSAQKFQDNGKESVYEKLQAILHKNTKNMQKNINFFQNINNFLGFLNYFFETFDNFMQIYL